MLSSIICDNRSFIENVLWMFIAYIGGQVVAVQITDSAVCSSKTCSKLE